MKENLDEQGSYSPRTISSVILWASNPRSFQHLSWSDWMSFARGWKSLPL